MLGLKELRGQKTFEELELEMQGIKYTTSTIEILKLYFIHGIGYTEIANVLGIYRQRVYQRIKAHQKRQK
jgi:predicted DNA-binding protein YlxM (UPF0122 family)